jgi:ubiquinone/menaquinone biosynthesis C-methylase UbiE
MNRQERALSTKRSVQVRHEQRRRWDRRSATWDDHGSAGLSRVVEVVLQNAQCAIDSRVADLGAGTGQLTIPLARRAGRVWAVDISPGMLERLLAQAREMEIENITPIESSIESVDFPVGSLDLVVSNYALHHLTDQDKQRVVMRAAQWLKPGGQLVIGDMMFGLGGDRRDRQIIASKLAAFARKGLPGWWRIFKNAVRFVFRIRERPVSIQTWVTYLEAAGFGDIEYEPVVAEAVVMTAAKPA